MVDEGNDLDFAKAFDKVPHQRLLIELYIKSESTGAFLSESPRG